MHTPASLAKPPLRCLATGVPGFDDVLGGGLPEFSFNLLTGPSGSGKTTLAHQIMFAQATPVQPALYFTVLGDSPLKMLRYQKQFDFFDLNKLNQAIRFINLANDVAGGDLDQVMARIKAEVAVREPHLVIIDSFASLVQSHTQHDNADIRARQFIQNLSELMASWQATTLLIGESFADAQADAASKPNAVTTIADGLIRLGQTVQGHSVVRKMDIMKMRGQATLPGPHTFHINAQGIKVFPPPVLLTARGDACAPPPKPRLKMGNVVLDDMMGGGLPAGYSLLVAGPSGSGKSILAMAFLLEGCRSGETGVIAAFAPFALQAGGDALQALIEWDKVSVIETGSTALSVDDVATLILGEVRRLKATRVVIDSLRADFPQALSRLVQALTREGVNVLLTSEQEDHYGDLRLKPCGGDLVTDAIIVQRYVELDSRLQRVMAVVKVRASAHADALRQFHIDELGIHIDGALPGYDGLLSGRPGPRLSLSPVIDVALDS